VGVGASQFSQALPVVLGARVVEGSKQPAAAEVAQGNNSRQRPARSPGLSSGVQPTTPELPLGTSVTVCPWES
jgi:hypothetical protein